MTYLWLLIGIALPTVDGWLLLRLTEGKTPVLFAVERWVLGFVLGMTLTMFASFFANISGLIAFTRMGFLSVQIILTVVAGIFWLLRRKQFPRSPHPTLHSPLPTFTKIIVAIFGVWIVVKIVAGTLLLTLSPPYFDDAYNNWNMRGKVFYYEQNFTLEMQTGNEMVTTEGVTSYPPTVPMAKTWLSVLKGTWNEGLINSIHMLWYLSAIALVWFVLRRLVAPLWTFIGIYLLTSLPLFLIHGSNAYADAFLAVHLFAALSLLFLGIREQDTDKRASFLRLGAVAAGTLVFTKNEALVLYLPPILLLLCASLFMLKMPTKEKLMSLAWYAVCIGIVSVPWVGFKWMNGLTFGNAKPIGGTALAWQEGVLNAVWINTFFEGNWIFLFPLLIGLLIAMRTQAFRTSLVVLTAFVVIVYSGQMFIFLFTSVSAEALRQTGYARALIHLVPIVTVVVTVLLSSLLTPTRENTGERGI